MKAAVTVKENYEFRRIYRKGKSAASPCLVVYCQKNRQKKSRLGITVSTKLGGAVIRNRVRRRLREIYRLNRDILQPGYDLIVVGRVRAVRTSYQDLNREFLLLTEKLQLHLEKKS
ncbi:MAG: ribonuclease P protein component [Clostridiales bacterium]|nr:ribonuclease P protein component [Clostridiales bacterium]